MTGSFCVRHAPGDAALEYSNRSDIARSVMSTFLRFCNVPVVMLAILWHSAPAADAGELVGVTVTPHVIAPTMKYRKPRDPDLAARVKLFIRGPATPRLFGGRTPDDLLASGDWSWHDMHTLGAPLDGALSVWTFNARANAWGPGQSFKLDGDDLPVTSVSITSPVRWISNITFLSSGDSVQPDSVIVHVVNATDEPLQAQSLRFWLPEDRMHWQTLWPQAELPVALTIAAQDRGVLQLATAAPLPLTYCAIELKTNHGTLWEHLRIKRETFDISGGWIGDDLTDKSSLQRLKRLHINTGQIQEVAGYTDRPEVYDRYPIKLFNRLMPLEVWDTDAWLPRIHAVEFLGEPQFGGGRPVPPQEVFDALLPYRSSRLATTVTHSEERIWREYAGLSDYPHYDAYRVVAPAADSWRQYDRWNGKTISWGAPLETVGDMCRSLRETNRPLPCAYWSQGPHHGWDGAPRLFGGRARRSPTPDELRAQALHGLSTRITSLYWFNLSSKSLDKFPDTWEPITRIGREIRMLEPYYLAGDGAWHERRVSDAGQPDWDLATIVSPDAAVLFALDLAYQPDSREQVFLFGEPRSATFPFPLPRWLRHPVDVFRVDADGIHDVEWMATETGVSISDTRSRDAIYVAARHENERGLVEHRRQQAISSESGDGLRDPGH
jgi:hypothetical protein